MKDNFTNIPLLQQREIEMKVIGPLVGAFAAEFGEEKTYEIVRRTMQDISRNLGEKTSKECGGGLESFKNNCMPKWTEGGALECGEIEDSADVFSFNVTRCDFAELYKELGCGDIGALISCDRDFAFINGFDKNLELVRKKTLMAGDDCCDFCYKKKD